MNGGPVSAAEHLLLQARLEAINEELCEEFARYEIDLSEIGQPGLAAGEITVPDGAPAWVSPAYRPMGK